MTQTAAGLRDAFHYLLEGEVEFLQDIARRLPPNPTVINIGAGVGTSALAFLEAREDIQVITVDLRAEPSPLGSLGSEQNAIVEAGLWGSPRFRQIQGDSKAVGAEWLGGAVDLVFIDGDHSYEGCSGDLRAWRPHLKIGGYLVFHDMANAPWGDVEGVVRDLVRTDPMWEEVGLVSITIAFQKRSIAGSGIFALPTDPT